VESPSLEIFQPRLAAVLCSLLWVTLLGQGVGLGDPRGPFQPWTFCEKAAACSAGSWAARQFVFEPFSGSVWDERGAGHGRIGPFAAAAAGGWVLGRMLRSWRSVGGGERFPPRFSLPVYIEKSQLGVLPWLGAGRRRRGVTRSAGWQGGPWLTICPLPFPGVADSRERPHPVPDGAGGGPGRPFQESRHRGLAPDGAQRAAQRRYGARALRGRQASLARVSLACRVFWRRACWLVPLLSSPSCLGLVNHPANGSAWEHRDTWLTAPALLWPLVILSLQGQGAGNCLEVWITVLKLFQTLFDLEVSSAHS